MTNEPLDFELKQDGEVAFISHPILRISPLQGSPTVLRDLYTLSEPRTIRSVKISVDEHGHAHLLLKE
jgi:hypothetical protein